MWTLVGGGMKTLQDSGRPMGEVLPKKADWIKQKVVGFKPEENKVVLEDQSEVGYDFLIVSLGLQLNYGIIKGLPEAFETPGVCSNYSPLYVNKTLEALKNFKGGNALFTLPNTAVKCAGAPQKIMYIADEYLRKNGKRDKAQVRFLTAGGVIFGVKKYADALTKYDMIHITPPMSAPDVLRKSTTLVDGSGFLNINKETLQHVTYPNIFGIGDCTNLPTSKTAAAAAAQVGILKTNLEQAIKGQKLTAKYDGYTSCPLVTGYSKCILAEFDFDGNPMETFPLNQAKERRSMFHMKKDFMPILYWEGMLKGLWDGPKLMRKAMHLGLSK
ncbi:Sulfide:quinone oxidoreductase, mitochondrial [Armadillidium nasatum]|uniref:Sulfide:quinone oxidoreductase, mitochondrial n=1 Tax=Armadillidium nasatum TaxID=96803 RepID=A0A5N5T647_9CRUS|nr:Sulfide:quinone oxidoreductase, mitochondrial [Armadillidium nasatum]